MNRTSLFRTLMVTALLSGISASAGLITTMTVTDSGGEHVTAQKSDYKFTLDTFLKDFTFDGTTYSSFNYVDTAVSSRSQVLYSSNATPYATNDNAATLQAVTDSRLDSAMVNVTNGDQFYFASAPQTLNDVVFFFEATDPFSNTEVQLVTSGNVLLGNSVTLGTEWTELANQDTAGNFSLSNRGYNGAALTLAELGIETAGELAQVGGFRVITANSVDLGLAGTATVIPEPSSIVLLGLAGILAFGVQRRHARR